MLIEIIGVIIVLMAIRALITKNRVERLLYINVIDFGISAIIALYIKTPFGLLVAASFFITSTIGSNAISYVLDKLDDEIVCDNEIENGDEIPKEN